jgi:rfaE bifunctional protein kinase chain/domain
MKRVLVIGAFNILHPGHIRLLRFAKECGDHLTIAVFSDKTTSQPIHVPESLRLECVESNSYVDEAFITDESPTELVERVQPDILVKGREHENLENPEEEVLKRYGGELLFESGEVSYSSIELLRKEFSYSETNQITLPHGYMERHNIEISTLTELLDKLSTLKVVVVGDLIMDEYIICDPLGMSQEDPTIVVSPIDKELFVGGAGIVAAHAAGLGAKKSELITVTGQDLLSEQANSMLKTMQVSPNFTIDQHRPTTLKQRFRTKEKTLLRVSHLHQSDISEKFQKKILEKVALLLEDAHLLVFSDFNYGVLPDELVKKISKLAEEKGIYTVADSQSSSQIGDISRYKGINLLTPTEREARIALQDYSSGLVILAEKLKQKTKVENILLKLGEEGVLIHANNPKENSFITDRISALNSTPKDVAGAGDSMLITAAMILSVGGTIWEASLLGSLAASLQVSKLGNQPLNISELNRHLI